MPPAVIPDPLRRNPTRSDHTMKDRRNIAGLAVPWAAIVTLACVSLYFVDDLSTVQASIRDRILTDTHYKQIISEEHDPLFPLTKSDIYGFTFAILGLMIAAGGGIGGGGILVPTYIILLGFSPKHAIPLSNVTVFGGSVANTLLNIRKRHPLADRPLIDWDLILVMEPLTIAGALVGAFLNKVLPELLLTVLLVLLLSFTAHTTLTKAVKMYKAETKAMRKANAGGGSKESELTRMTANEYANSEEEAGVKLLGHAEEIINPDEEEQKLNEAAAAAKRNDELEQILEEEKTLPVANLLILTAMFVVVLGINVLKGGGAFPSPLGIKCGSKSFWMANLVMFLWILTISAFVRQFLVRKYKAKERCGFKYVEGDIKWDGRATIVYPFVCCFAGFFAGMFGIGGGIVKGPLMLALGVHPAVGAATSACMILFTCFTATTSFIVFGLLVPDYAVACVIIGFFATLVGQIGLSYLMEKAQRNSYIAFSIGAVVLLSAFLMTIQSLLSLVAGEQHHSGGICGKGD